MHIDEGYHPLRLIRASDAEAPKTARRAVLQVLGAHNGNVSKTARIFKISRATVYKAIEKDAEKNLDDSSRAPHTVHNKTDTELEARVLQIRKQTAYGPLRIKEELEELDQIVFQSTLYAIFLDVTEMKPNQDIKKPPIKPNAILWTGIQPKHLKWFRLTFKYIVDQKALSMEQIHHIYTKNLPLYQDCH